MISMISWNVNGLRSLFEGRKFDEIFTQKYDVIALQEVKLTDISCLKGKIPSEYHIFYNLSANKGRNGVITLSKLEPNSVDYVINDEIFDSQGRYVKLNYNKFSMINLYMPHGKRDKSNLPFKISSGNKIIEMLCSLKTVPIIIACDFNIARNDIDVCRAKQNCGNTMFTDQERQLIDRIDGNGYKDVFREKYSDKVKYTWWSYAFNCRERGIGWRIDYFFVSQILLENICDIKILDDVFGSDHCPIEMFLKI